MSILSDSRINRDYTTKVFQALSISDDPHTLIRTYVRTAKPCLTEPNDIVTYAIALAESSLMEAWMYQRTFPEINKTRERLVNKILDWCLTREFLIVLPQLLLYLLHSSKTPSHCTQTPAGPSFLAIRGVTCQRLRFGSP